MNVFFCVLKYKYISNQGNLEMKEEDKDIVNYEEGLEDLKKLQNKIEEKSEPESKIDNKMPKIDFSKMKKP